MAKTMASLQAFPSSLLPRAWSRALIPFPSLSNACHAGYFFPNKTLSCIWVAIPVDWVILHWYACGADGRSRGRSVGRCTVTWLPNFFGWVDYHISSAMGLRPRTALRAALPETIHILCEIKQLLIRWLIYISYFLNLQVLVMVLRRIV